MNSENNNTGTKIEVENGYAMLKQLCSFQANRNAFKPTSNPITNRVEFITHKLQKNGVSYHLDRFIARPLTPSINAENVNQPQYVNIICEIEGIDKTQTSIFIAHHDVANMASENCQDNSASVCNLIDLAIQLTKDVSEGNLPLNNVVIVFTDAEEPCNTLFSGAARLCNNILSGLYRGVKYVVNSELTAQGKNVWMSYGKPNLLSNTINERHSDKGILKVFTPFSDSVTVREFGIDTVCLGILDDENYNFVKRFNFCETWALCHSKDDTFENSANEGDMNEYVIFLKTLI